MADTVSRELTDRTHGRGRTTPAQPRRSWSICGRALEAQTAKIALLATMSQRLQGCSSEDEIASCVTCFAPRILTGIPGILYVLDQSKAVLRAMARWNAPASATEEFAAAECWGIRRGHVHAIEDAHNDIVCGHVHAAGTRRLLLPSADRAAARPSACFISRPTARRLTISRCSPRTWRWRWPITACARSLRSQSIHVDPLTGLYNRRYLEEVMEHDIARASRSGEPFALIMADLDHFKRINDRFGHDAGDLVLKEFAQALQAQIRKGDVACRYGGEEFIVLVRGATVEAAAARADAIRQAVASLKLSVKGTALGPVTVSLGVAAYGDHAGTASALIALADGALYAAKRNGRNRVEITRANSRIPAKAA